MGKENFERAALARKALEVFATESGQEIPGETIEAATDLITNLLHLINQQTGGDVEAVHQQALDTYNAEINDDE